MMDIRGEQAVTRLWYSAPATDWHAALPVDNGH
jgi:hypothetical protein